MIICALLLPDKSMAPIGIRIYQHYKTGKHSIGSYSALKRFNYGAATPLNLPGYAGLWFDPSINFASLFEAIESANKTTKQFDRTPEEAKEEIEHFNKCYKRSK